MIKSNVEGKAMVFKNERDGMRPWYQVQMSHKNVDGSWSNAYIRIQFKKDVELENRTEIVIRNAWIDFFKTKNNETVFYIKCIDFDIAGGNVPAWEGEVTDMPF